MAKKSRKKNGKKAGLIAFGASLLAYALIFKFNKLSHYLIGGGLSALVGYVVSIMAAPMKGLDKNAKAKDEMNVTVIEDEYARQVVEDGVAMLDALKAERDAIGEYVFTRRLDTLRANYDQLLRAVIEDPDKASRLRKFNSYYLPTAVKLLQSYRSAKDKGTSYMTISATREDILEMLDKLISATAGLHDTLMQADLEDMDIEMDVFDRMLKSDGLTEDGLTEDMRQAAHAAAKEAPMSAAPTVKPTAAAPAPKPASKPVQQPAAQPAHAAKPVYLDHQVQAEAREQTPPPVLNVPVTASAAQLDQGAPVLRVPQSPIAPDFAAASKEQTHTGPVDRT